MSCLTEPGEIPLGLDWKNLDVTETMFFLPAGLLGSREEVTGVKRSLMASKGTGAVACTSHVRESGLKTEGAVTSHGLQLLPSMSHVFPGMSLYGFQLSCEVQSAWHQEFPLSDYFSQDHWKPLQLQPMLSHLQS